VLATLADLIRRPNECKVKDQLEVPLLQTDALVETDYHHANNGGD
jgi:hypothetical protein